VADIFVSYARADKLRVAPLVAALESQGWSVWWDPEITPGQEFDSQIAAALDAAKAVVVVWTPTSVDSRWVRGEAREAADRGVLAPVRFEAARLPIDFRALHTTDLDDWREDCSSRCFEDLARALKARIGGASPAAAAAAAPAAAARRGPSICVLPFANMSGDAEQEYFADGISEDIITDLSKVSSLFVIARNTAFTFKGRSLEVPQVARQLSVSHVLEGSVRKAGARVRINAQLIDGASGGHLWAERWDRDLDDIFALQDEICQAIVGALKLKLLPREKEAIGDRGGTSFEVYDKYLRARAAAVLARSATDLMGAVDLYREALALDPHFAPALSGLALICFWFGMVAPAEARERVFAEVSTVLERGVLRDSDHWGAHLVRGFRQFRQAGRKDWLAAITALEKAWKSAPSVQVDLAELFATCLASVGRIRDAIAVMEAAREADPLTGGTSNFLQMTYLMDGRDGDSQAEYERSLALPWLREPAEHSALFRIWNGGSVEDKRRQFQRYLDCQVIQIPGLSKCLEAIDRPDAAAAALREAFDDPGNEDGARMAIIGWHAGLYGDVDLAVKATRRGQLEFDFPAKYMIWWPSLKSARQTADFKQLVRDLGVYDYWRASGNWGDFARPLGEDDFELIG
jgi:adenylate cyclase